MSVAREAVSSRHARGNPTVLMEGNGAARAWHPLRLLIDHLPPHYHLPITDPRNQDGARRLLPELVPVTPLEPGAVGIPRTAPGRHPIPQIPHREQESSGAHARLSPSLCHWLDVLDLLERFRYVGRAQQLDCRLRC